MTNDEKNIKDDFEYSRATYYELLEKGKESLMDMMEVARSSEHPRAYEVLSNLIKNMADVNGNLLDLHKKKKDYHSKDTPKELPSTTTNNNLFVGSTTDLQRMLLSKDSEPNDNVVDISDYSSDK